MDKEIIYSLFVLEEIRGIILKMFIISIMGSCQIEKVLALYRSVVI
jgi:hypothetical protein